MSHNIESGHIVHGIAPVADAFTGTVNSDIIEVAGEGIEFLLYKGVGTTGTSTLTVDACDDTSASNTTAVAFWYRANTTSDTWGAWTEATTAGFATTAGSNHIYQIWVPASYVGSAGYKYARLTAVEVVDDPVLGGIMARVINTRYQPMPYSLID
jgi:hypothetical protein